MRTAHKQCLEDHFQDDLTNPKKSCQIHVSGNSFRTGGVGGGGGGGGIEAVPAIIAGAAIATEFLNIIIGITIPPPFLYIGRRSILNNVSCVFVKVIVMRTMQSIFFLTI